MSSNTYPELVREGICNQCKIWIGNVDTKLTEYQLLKVAEQFGKIASYDFLYNVSENGHRTPRGYSFITYSSPDSAAAAVKQLHRKRILNRQE